MPPGRVVTVDRGALEERERHALGPVGLEPEAVGDLDPGAPRVRERQRRDQAVRDPRIDVADLELTDRAARTAGAEREAQRADRLDDVLLGHHRGLGGEDRIAVVPELVQRRGRDGIALPQPRRVHHVGRRRALGVVRVAARAKRVVELAVEALLRIPRRDLAERRIVEDRERVQAAVDRSGLEAHDVAHDVALIVRGRGDDRRRVVQVVGLIGAARGSPHTGTPPWAARCSSRRAADRSPTPRSPRAGGAGR
jgi:hypothetical protein